MLQNETEVKFESEEYKALCKSMEALKREKVKLKVPFDKLENLEVALRVKADTDKALDPKHRAVANAKTALSSLLDGMKRAEAFKGDEEPKILQEMAQELAEATQKAIDAKDAAGKAAALCRCAMSYRALWGMLCRF